MKMVSFGADVSCNDVSCSDDLIRNIKQNLDKVLDKGAIYTEVTNVTGDDLVITAVCEDDDLEIINKSIVSVLHDYGESLGDVGGIGDSPSSAGEGVSYSIIDLDPDFYPDGIIIGFDTYAGESFVADVAKSAMQAASGMDYVGSIGGGCVDDIIKIPGVGYVSDKTDDPVVSVSVNNIEHVGVVAGAMIGAILGNKNTYLVKRGTPANVIPGSVIFSVTAFLNGNIIDLAEPFNHKMRILKK